MFAPLSRFEPQAHGLLRIIAGLMFLSHGLVKLAGFPRARSRGSNRPCPCYGSPASSKYFIGTTPGFAISCCG